MHDPYTHQGPEEVTVWPPAPSGPLPPPVIPRRPNNRDHVALKCAASGVGVEALNIALCSFSRGYLHSALFPYVLGWSGFLLWVMAFCMGLTHIRSWMSLLAIVISVGCTLGYIAVIL